MLFNQSRGILLTQKLFKQEEAELGSELFLNQYNQTHIRKEVLNALPFYYRHLFLKKQNFSADFLVGRDKEKQKVSDYIQNFRNGFHGALAITGQRHSGKSFMAKIMADQFFPPEDVLIIQPPLEGRHTD